MIRFHFELRPIVEIEPWGPNSHLHWFGLTDGWYWIDVDGHELLRYADRSLRRCSGDRHGRSHPYVAYSVVRLWEDVIGLLPSAMEVVPDDLVEFMSSDQDAWLSPDGPAVDTAVEWHFSHWLNSGHLRSAPRILWWRTMVDGDDLMNVAWKHPHDGQVEFAAPEKGRTRLSTSVFVAAVQEFDRALLAAMGQRIAELDRVGPPRGVHIDMERLRVEQRDRATWLQRARDVEPTTDWAAVRNGVGRLLPHG